MEQLANMPLWAQMLSMGSFMFASGILMARLPLLPALLLSIFYFYGLFNSTGSPANFIFQQPSLGKWLLVHLIYIGIIILIILGGILKGGGRSWESALARDLGLMFVTVLFILICLIPAFIKWISLLRALPGPFWLTVLWCVLFTGGLLFGILTGIKFLNEEGLFLRGFVPSLLMAAGACGCCLFSIFKGGNLWGMFSGCASFVLVSLLLLFFR